ncbi:stage III sporulation protein AD [Domibacillus sp. A3M-37]|uniref:SpoIIIAC/SpoIIIAD family protein n=1 Tax=Domibacillus sp. A3M-37 TaxID=2962037 RepID=UPI0020B8FCD8|nr:SpoIIIAC/SpoIIIAD family protein [Domibacillus sp. A3M-37]MCP3763296.1 stage III sporulation protein AD [Domibacillus sp. A3M-37]
MLDSYSIKLNRFFYFNDRSGLPIAITHIAAIILVAVFLAILLDEFNPGFSLLFILFTCSILFYQFADEMAKLITAVRKMAAYAAVETLYIETVLKAVGVAFISEFIANIAKDAGQQALAAKMEIAGKIIIMALILPILTLLIETVLNMLPGR